MTQVIVGFKKRFRLAAMLLIFGLLVEGICLLWARPLGFILLLCGGGSLCAVGIVLYLYLVVSAGGSKRTTD